MWSASRALRVTVLLAAGVLSAASASNPRSAPGPGATSAAPARGYFCHTERSTTSTASMCRPDFAACEGERQAAAAEGLEVTGCTAAGAVACFQLGDDPSPAATWCSATLEDCELWRRLDAEKNASQSGPCSWK